MEGNDPVELGLVASLNRPGGNLTGVAALGTEISAKRLELLHKLVPAADLIAMLVSSTGLPYDRAEIRGAESAGRALGVRLLLLPASNDSDVAAAFATLVEQRAGALLIGGSTPLDNAREQIISLAARHSIPMMFYFISSVGLGGLVSYGPDVPDAYRQTGIYVGRILKGEKPADLPVQQPTRFPLLINLKTAGAMGSDQWPRGSSRKRVGLRSPRGEAAKVASTVAGRCLAQSRVLWHCTDVPAVQGKRLLVGLPSMRSTSLTYFLFTTHNARPSRTFGMLFGTFR